MRAAFPSAPEVRVGLELDADLLEVALDLAEDVGTGQVVGQEVAKALADEVAGLGCHGVGYSYRVRYVQSEHSPAINGFWTPVERHGFMTGAL